MPKTMTCTSSLTITTCWCGIPHAVPDELYSLAKRNHEQIIYCPLGHQGVISGPTEVERLKKELRWSEDARVQLVAERDQAFASRRAWKGQATKLRNRTAKGECSFCGAKVYQLGRHITRRHPDEASQVLDAGSDLPEPGEEQEMSPGGEG